jgi:hypothetical protein
LPTHSHLVQTIQELLTLTIMTSPNNHSKALRRIGQGFCGTVWADFSGIGDAIKREDGGPGRSLHEFVMHQMILKYWSGKCAARVPRCYQYIASDDQWWERILSKYPSTLQPCNVMVTERIPPFLDGVRERLIDTYCPEKLRPSIKMSEPDRDCMIRPYLGRRRRLATSRFQAFSLRNYPLHVDQMEEMALDTIMYARIMAETLAH